MAMELVKFDDLSCYTKRKEEAEFIYREIFTDHCYDVPNLPENPFVVDVGANIGLFSLYIKHKYPGSKILAFEPAPETFEVLLRNLTLHNFSDVQAFPLGLASEPSIGELTFFPNMPGNSTLYPEQKQTLYEMAIKLRPEEADGRFDTGQKVHVKLQRLSHILNTFPDTIGVDLLKIDVEGAELEVLLGLDDNHWSKVHNVVLETCMTSGVVIKIEKMLQSKGFTVAREGAPWSPEEFFTIRAHRDDRSVLENRHQVQK